MALGSPYNLSLGIHHQHVENHILPNPLISEREMSSILEGCLVDTVYCLGVFWDSKVWTAGVWVKKKSVERDLGDVLTPSSAMLDTLQVLVLCWTPWCSAEHPPSKGFCSMAGIWDNHHGAQKYKVVTSLQRAIHFRSTVATPRSSRKYKVLCIWDN